MYYFKQAKESKMICQKCGQEYIYQVGSGTTKTYCATCRQMVRRNNIHFKKLVKKYKDKDQIKCTWCGYKKWTRSLEICDGDNGEILLCLACKRWGEDNYKINKKKRNRTVQVEQAKSNNTMPVQVEQAKSNNDIVVQAGQSSTSCSSSNKPEFIDDGIIPF